MNSGFVKYIQCVLVGIVTGFFAGLTGVGGGEFRIPFLINLFRNNLKTAAAINLLVGSFTVVVAIIRRWKYIQEIQLDLWYLAIVFSISSILGSYFGVKKIIKFSGKLIEKIMIYYLFIVGIWMIIESTIHLDNGYFSFTGIIGYIAAFVLGFTIASISVTMGVAGGEMRIPVLIYLYAIPIKIAGSISLIVSIPTVISGAFNYKKLGYLPTKAVVISLLIATGSVVGIFFGVYWLNTINTHLLTGILGTILILAAFMIKLTDKTQ